MRGGDDESDPWLESANAMHRIRSMAFAVAIRLAAPLGLAVQGGNFLMPIPRIEALLRDSSFQVIDARGARAEGDRTSREGMQFGEEAIMIAQWAPAARGGAEFNNEPRTASRPRSQDRARGSARSRSPSP
jgi:hypothetical protein